jgi:hypothetical protein
MNKRDVYVGMDVIVSRRGKIKSITEEKVLVNFSDSWITEPPYSCGFDKCEPIMPGFGKGDRVMHVPTGAVGTVGSWPNGKTMNEDTLTIVMPSVDGDVQVPWRAIECKILRK